MPTAIDEYYSEVAIPRNEFSQFVRSVKGGVRTGGVWHLFSWISTYFHIKAYLILGACARGTVVVLYVSVCVCVCVCLHVIVLAATYTLKTRCH